MKHTEFARILNSLVGRREPFAVATVVRTEGSSLGKPGFKLIISKEGETVYGSLGGVCPESAIVSTAQGTMKTGQPKTVRVFLESVEKAVEGTVVSQSEDEIHVETNCGGTMEVYVEPYLPQNRMILVGQGGKDDVEDALVKMGKTLDFEVIVVDHSPVLSEEPDQLIKEMDYDLSRFKFGESDSVVVLTKGARDVEILGALSRFKLKFVGLLASRQRVKDDLEALRAHGYPEKFVESIRAPVGADIGAVTPSEIALSIISDIVATKYGKELPHKDVKQPASLRTPERE
ncbi:MAG TPA: XdhC family protein [Nitrososphaerales archaeon]|nr:XdhC family protein [Nitrososphaerales archaeon]